MSPRGSRWVLGAVLAATLVAAWLAPSSPDDGVALSERAKSVRAPAADAAGPARSPAARGSVQGATPSPAEVLSIRGREPGGDDDEEARLFAATQWTPPPQPAPAAASAPLQAVPALPPPPPAQAPPLPFRVLGRYEEGGRAVVFLQYNDQNLVVRVGDTLAEQYKVEGLSGTALTLRYLPLNQLQSLDIGGVQ